MKYTAEDTAEFTAESPAMFTAEHTGLLLGSLLVFISIFFCF